MNEKRTKLDLITRCMWYIRNFSNYNIWKKQEFKDRVWFQNEFNNEFNIKYK